MTDSTSEHRLDFSLVIPAYNEEELLPRLLKTVQVARERYVGGADRIEVIMGNNASTDRTADIAREFGCRVAFVEKRCIAAARNGGAAIARGEIVCFTDADGQIHPETFNVIKRTMDTGKYVAGALYDLSDADMKLFDTKVDRRLNGEKEVGLYKRIEIKVAPLGKGEPVMATTYQGVSVEKYHIPPTQHYMDLVIQGAYSHGLSMMWIQYIQSFSIQAGRKPRPPGAGDSSAKL